MKRLNKPGKKFQTISTVFFCPKVLYLRKSFKVTESFSSTSIMIFFFLFTQAKALYPYQSCLSLEVSLTRPNDEAYPRGPPDPGPHDPSADLLPSDIDSDIFTLITPTLLYIHEATATHTTGVLLIITR